MLYLQRTKCGIFDIEQSFTIEDVKNGNYDIIEPDVLFDYEKYDLTDNEFLKLQNGQSVVSEKHGLFKAYYRNEYLGNIRIENGLIKFELKLF